MDIQLQQLTAQEFCQLAPVAVELYLEAMAYPASMAQGRVAVWVRDSQQPGFSAVCAHDGTYLLGIAYGFAGGESHWWTREIKRGVLEHGGPSEHERKVLSDFFELAEIHVSPKRQGHGIGAQLLQSLLHTVTAHHVVLSTPEVEAEDNNAFRLYRRFGFEDFLRNFRFRGDQRRFAVLTRSLPLTQT